MISGFRRGVNDVFALLECCAASIIYRRFGTVYKSRFTLEGSVYTSMQSPYAGIDQSTLRNITEERRPKEV